MLHLLLALAAALPAPAPQAAAPAPADDGRVYGVETTIPNAGGGGIRTHIAGPAGSNAVFLQDRTLRWYRVQLSGECVPPRVQTTIFFRTNPDNRLDRLSYIGSSWYPNRVCGVTSITTSPPPPEAPRGPRPPRPRTR